MSEALSYVIGAIVCCGAPLLSFGAGAYYAKFGLPFSFQWRGMHRLDEDDE